MTTIVAEIKYQNAIGYMAYEEIYQAVSSETERELPISLVFHVFLEFLR